MVREWLCGTSSPRNSGISGSLDGLRPLLEGVDTPASTTETDGEGTWRVYRDSFGGSDPLSIDPSTGSFTRGPVANRSSTPLEFPDPRVNVELALHLDAGGNPDGTVRLTVATPSAILRLPFLRGALLDAQGQLRPDPANPDVRFLLPALRIRVRREAAGGVSASLLSAATGVAVDQIYDFVRMEPAHALIGPGNTVGFAFRAAVLDLSGTAGPSGVPPEARAMPGDWQGLWLPEARLFVSPNGLEGLAVSAGVRDLWIGIGRHAGVTGIFEAEVVNRGTAPTIRLRFQTASGEWIGVPDADGGTPLDVPETSTVFVDASGGIAPLAYTLVVGGGATVTSDRAMVTAPATGTLSIVATATDAGAHTTTRTINVRRRTAGPGGAPVAPGGQPVAARMTSATPSRVVVATQTATDVTLALSPAGGDITWSWPGGAPTTGATVTVPVAAGAPVVVTAVRSHAAATLLQIDAYTLFNRPAPTEGVAFADNPHNVHAAPASDRGWGSSPELVDQAFCDRIAALPAGTTWTVEGWASYEDDNSQGQQDRNMGLSRRRRDALIRILECAGATGITPGTAHGHDAARDGVSPDPPAGAAPPRDPSWWHARAKASLGAATSETVTAELTRPPAQPPADPDPRPTDPGRPDFFRKLGVRVELIRSTFIRAELYGEFDIQTAAEERPSQASSRAPPAAHEPERRHLHVPRPPAGRRGSVVVAGERRAARARGRPRRVWRRSTRRDGDPTAVDIIGAVATLGPLLAAATPPSPTAGGWSRWSSSASAALGTGPAASSKHARDPAWRRGLVITAASPRTQRTGSGPTTTQVSVLLDIETAFTFDLGFVRVDPAHP